MAPQDPQVHQVRKEIKDHKVSLDHQAHSDRLARLEILDHWEVRGLQGPEVNPVHQDQPDQRALWETLVRADLPDQPDQLGALDRSESLVIRGLLDRLDLEGQQVYRLPVKREKADQLDHQDQLGHQDQLDKVVHREVLVLQAS